MIDRPRAARGRRVPSLAPRDIGAPPNEFGALGLRPVVPLQGRCLHHATTQITRPRRWTTGRRPTGAISIAGPRWRTARPAG